MTVPVGSVVLWSPGFPHAPHAFMANYVTGLAAAGVDVTVVSNHDYDRRPGPGPTHAAVVEALWQAPLRYKVGRLAQLAPVALRASRGDTTRLVRRLVAEHRRPHAVLSRLYIDLPMLVPGADLVHIGWFDGAVFMHELLETVSAPTVVSCHGSDLLVDVADEAHRRGVVEVLERVDIVHCVSEDLRRAAMDLGVDADRIVTGHWGIDTHRFAPSPANTSPAHTGDPLRVVTIARLDPVKGLVHGLEAIAALRDRGVDVRYTIVGARVDDVPVDDVHETVERRGLGEVVEITGWVSGDDVRHHLACADVFMLPSLSEGIATAMLEAMAVGLPVVVTDVGGLSEAVRDGVEGLIVPPRDPAALADALERLATDREAGTEMGRRARERAIADHDLVGRTRHILDGFADVLARIDGSGS